MRSLNIHFTTCGPSKWRTSKREFCNCVLCLFQLFKFLRCLVQLSKCLVQLFNFVMERMRLFKVVPRPILSIGCVSVPSKSLKCHECDSWGICVIHREEHACSSWLSLVGHATLRLWASEARLPYLVWHHCLNNTLRRQPRSDECINFPDG